jgi:DNA-binding protein H-NS
MPDIDLTQLSKRELQELSKNIDKELKRREVEDKKNVLLQMKELAASVGMTVEEIIENTPQKKTKGEPKYQNPDDSTQTWTGRGKRPGWLNEQLDRGKTLKDLEIN